MSIVNFCCFFSLGSLSNGSSLEYNLARNTSFHTIFSLYLLPISESSKSLHLSRKRNCLKISYSVGEPDCEENLSHNCDGDTKMILNIGACL